MSSRFIHVIPTRVLGLPQSIEIDQRLDKKFRQGFIGAPAAAGRNENKLTVSLALSLGWMRWFLIWGEGRGGSRGQARGGGLGVLSTPLVVLSAGGQAQYPAYAPDTLFLHPALQKWQLGFLVSLYLVQNLPQMHNAHSYF